MLCKLMEQSASLYQIRLIGCCHWEQHNGVSLCLVSQFRSLEGKRYAYIQNVLYIYYDFFLVDSLAWVRTPYHGNSWSL